MKCKNCGCEMNDSEDQMSGDEYKEMSSHDSGDDSDLRLSLMDELEDALGGSLAEKLKKPGAGMKVEIIASKKPEDDEKEVMA